MTSMCEEARVLRRTAAKWLQVCGKVNAHSTQRGRMKWTAEAIVETSSLSENELGLYLRREDLYSHQIMEWRADVIKHVETRLRAHEVTAPRMLLSRDISYVLSPIRGRYYYLHLFLDVCSCKAVGAGVHEQDSMAHSSYFIDTMCHEGGVEKNQVSVHADNGGR